MDAQLENGHGGYTVGGELGYERHLSQLVKQLTLVCVRIETR